MAARHLHSVAAWKRRSAAGWPRQSLAAWLTGARCGASRKARACPCRVSTIRPAKNSTRPTTACSRKPPSPSLRPIALRAEACAESPEELRLLPGQEAIHAAGEILEIGGVAAGHLGRQPAVVADLAQGAPHFQPVDVAVAHVLPLEAAGGSVEVEVLHVDLGD